MYLTSYSSVDVNFKTTLNITSPQKFTPNPNPCNPPTQTLTNFTFSILRPRIISFHSMLQLNTQVNRAWCFHRHARLLISFLAWQSVTDRYRVRVSTRLSLSLSLFLLPSIFVHDTTAFDNFTMAAERSTARSVDADRARIFCDFPRAVLRPLVVGRARPTEVRETRIQFDSRTPALVARGASRDHSSLEMGSSVALRACSNFWSLDSEHFQWYWRVFWVFSEMRVNSRNFQVYSLLLFFFRFTKIL